MNDTLRFLRLLRRIAACECCQTPRVFERASGKRLQGFDVPQPGHAGSGPDLSPASAEAVHRSNSSQARAAKRRGLATIVRSSAAKTGFALFATLALAGCRGERSDKPPRQFFPDMDDQPKYKAQAQSEFFADHRSMRLPVAGTVPFGARSFDAKFEGRDFSHRETYLRDNTPFFEGKEAVLDADGKPVLEADGRPREMYLERLPITVDDELLALGEKKFNILCIVCHGGLGDGKGAVGVRWAYSLPTFHDAQYQHGGEKGQDGYIFHTILNGVPNVGENMPYPLKMPSYANKVSEREAWAIVAYFRTLQAAYNSPLEAAPERERQELERRRPLTPTPAPTPAAATTVPAGKERGS